MLPCITVESTRTSASYWMLCSLKTTQMTQLGCSHALHRTAFDIILHMYVMTFKHLGWGSISAQYVLLAEFKLVLYVEPLRQCNGHGPALSVRASWWHAHQISSTDLVVQCIAI